MVQKGGARLFRPSLHMENGPSAMTGGDRGVFLVSEILENMFRGGSENANFDDSQTI